MKKEICDEVVLQILKVEEPLTLARLWRWLPGTKLGDVDEKLWELNRQGRVHRDELNGEEVWLYGAKTN